MANIKLMRKKVTISMISRKYSTLNWLNVNYTDYIISVQPSVV